jgi:hypothetical protein
MERSTDKLVDQITRGERACAALDRTVREMRRLQERAVGNHAVPALARAHAALESPDGEEAPFGSGSLGIT